MILMKRIDSLENVTYGSESVYELEYTVLNGQVSDPIYVPDVGKPISMGLFPAGGASGYIECTNDIYSKIADGTAGSSDKTTGTNKFEMEGGNFSLASDVKIGFFGKTPVVQQTMGSATATGSYGATEQAMLQAVYDAVRAVGIGS